MIINVLIKIFIFLALVVPIIWLTYNRDKNNYKNIILFFVYYAFWCIFNSPIREVVFNFNFFESQWNWTGKILAFIFSILFILSFKKRFYSDNFFTLRQKERSKKPIVFSIIIILTLAIIFNIFTGNKIPFNFDTLAFQISMPGLDEEFAHRGIMLGLLCSALKDHICVGKTKLVSPAVLVTATLFGLIHGIPLTPYLDWKFDYFSFGYTFIFGLVYGWMVLKSRSILMPSLSHGLTNFSSVLITMIK